MLKLAQATSTKIEAVRHGYLAVVIKLQSEDVSMTLSIAEDRQRWWRFALVGLSGTLVDLILLGMLKMLGWATILANIVSYSVGIINNFWWNRHWTFASNNPDWLPQFLRFGAISLSALVINTLIVAVTEAPLNDLWQSHGYVLAKGVATMVGFAWNFSLNRIWTFNLEHEVVA
jgi:putative flippase GtrA